MTKIRPRVKNKHKIDIRTTNYKKFVKSIENLASITSKWCKILSANSKPLQNILSNAVLQDSPRQNFKTKNLLLKYLSKSSSLQILLFFTAFFSTIMVTYRTATMSTKSSRAYQVGQNNLGAIDRQQLMQIIQQLNSTLEKKQKSVENDPNVKIVGRNMVIGGTAPPKSSRPIKNIVVTASTTEITSTIMATSDIPVTLDPNLEKFIQNTSGLEDFIPLEEDKILITPPTPVENDTMVINVNEDWDNFLKFGESPSSSTNDEVLSPSGVEKNLNDDTPSETNKTVNTNGRENSLILSKTKGKNQYAEWMFGRELTNTGIDPGFRVPAPNPDVYIEDDLQKLPQRYQRTLESLLPERLKLSSQPR